MGLPVASALDLKQIGTPATPGAGLASVYAKSGGDVYVKAPSGTEYLLGGPSADSGPPIEEDPADEGTYIIHSSLITEDPADEGTYLIGA